MHYPPGNGYISHQTGSLENHRLKMPFLGGYGFVPWRVSIVRIIHNSISLLSIYVKMIIPMKLAVNHPGSKFCMFWVVLSHVDGHSHRTPNSLHPSNKPLIFSALLGSRFPRARKNPLRSRPFASEVGRKKCSGWLLSCHRCC